MAAALGPNPTRSLLPALAAPVRFWEATSGICYRTLQYADSQVNKLEITADKTLIAAAGNPHIRCGTDLWGWW